MKEFKGTQGHWEFDDTEEVVVSEHGDVICTIGSYMTSYEEDLSNGPLLAAAPELLEALIEMTALVKKNSYPCPDKPSSNYARAEWAESIINKSLGEENETD